MVAGLDRGARAVDEMPGVDDGGEPLMWRPREQGLDRLGRAAVPRRGAAR